MNKQELTAWCNTLAQEVDFYQRGMSKFRQEVSEFMSIYKSGIAEDCPYNDGVIATLNYFAEQINRLSRIKVEPIDVATEEPDVPAFTIIKGGKA